MEVKEIIVRSIKTITGVEELYLEIPEREEFGDFSANVAMQVFASTKNKVQSTKILRQAQDDKIDSEISSTLSNSKSPSELAEAVVKQLENDKELMRYIEKITIAGPGFINFYVKNEVLFENVNEILAKADNCGKSNANAGRTVVIDYSAPNIAKRFSVGHLRSTIIGQALYNLYKALGYRVIGDNHLGDWGTQFGTLLYKITSKGLEPNVLSIDELEKLYIEFHQEVEDNPALQEEARNWFKKLEDGDVKAREIWKILIDKSMEEFEKVYRLLGVNLDYAYGESFYQEIMPEVIEQAKEKGVAIISQGALIIEVPEVKEPLILVKSDGATTYATRDLATLKFRKENWDPDIVIYEVGVEQLLHFQQVFSAARILGYVRQETELVHTKHGWYLGEDGKKFSTRKGKTVKLEEILNEAIERAKKLSDGDEELAQKVGVGAIKYFDLSHNIQSDIVFNWDKMFLMEGNSGPYLQYTYARTQSVLVKAQSAECKEQSLEIRNLKLEINKEELAVLRSLHQFTGVIEDAAKNYSPNLICNYLYELSQKFNTFYGAHRIVGVSAENKGQSAKVEKFRIALTAATGQVVKNGLGLLGIEAPDRM